MNKTYDICEECMKCTQYINNGGDCIGSYRTCKEYEEDKNDC